MVTDLFISYAWTSDDHREWVRLFASQLHLLGYNVKIDEAVGYDEIYELSAKVITEPEHREVIEAAYAQRKSGQPPSINVLFENISLLDSFIEPKIITVFNAKGNKDVI